MNAANREKLKKLYPKLDQVECGADCGDGWVPLLEKLIGDLNALNEPYTIEQIKEKFGGLRFYYTGLTQEGSDLVSRAERDSFKICEVCGDPGELRAKGWWKTLCFICYKRARIPS